MAGRGRIMGGPAAAVVAALAFLGGIGAAAARAEPLRVYAAGSLKGVLEKVIAASGLAVAPPVFGPAGLLRGRLAGGEAADLFLSADLAGPESLAAAGKAEAVVPFARNRLCVLAKADWHLAAATLLDQLLDPQLRLATSTPKADPGGDYAEAVFRRADALRPGAVAILEGKALRLLGSPGAMVPAPGRTPAATIFLENRADALLYYCSGMEATLEQVPGLAVTPLPASLAVPVVYGAALMSARPEAARLALFLVSEKGQTILADHGLVAMAAER